MAVPPKKEFAFLDAMMSSCQSVDGTGGAFAPILLQTAPRIWLVLRLISIAYEKTAKAMQLRAGRDSPAPASSPRYVKRHFEALPEYIVPLHCRAAMHTLPDPAGFDPVYPFFSAVQTAIYATRLE